MKAKHRKEHNRAFALACLHDDDKPNKITWDRIVGAIQGTEDPLRFPVSYPPIDFDPATKKMFITGCLIVAGGIVLGAAARGAIQR